MTNCFMDIESIPQQPEEEARALVAETIKPPAAMKAEKTIAEWRNGEGKYAGAKEAAIEKAYRDQSFDGAKGHIISIAFAVGDGEIQSRSGDDEKDLIAWALARIYMDLDGRPPFFVGHYIAGFDLRFLFQRCVILGVEPPFELPFSGRHGQHYFDTKQAWSGFGPKGISQDNLCKVLGIEGKPDGIDGALVYDFYKAGKIAEIEAYNRDDVSKVRQIYKRLTFS